MHTVDKVLALIQNANESFVEKCDSMTEASRKLGRLSDDLVRDVESRHESDESVIELVRMFRVVLKSVSKMSDANRELCELHEQAVKILRNGLSSVN